MSKVAVVLLVLAVFQGANCDGTIKDVLDEIKQIPTSLVDSTGNLLVVATELVDKLLEAAKKAISEALDLVKGAGGDASSCADKVSDSLDQLKVDVVGKVGKCLDDNKSKINNVIDSLINLVKEILQSVLGIFKGKLFNALEIPSKIVGVISKGIKEASGFIGESILCIGNEVSTFATEVQKAVDGVTSCANKLIPKKTP